MSQTDKIEINGITVFENGTLNSGLLAFILYDTYGFPFDVTRDVIKNELNIEVDKDNFDKYLEEQKNRSKCDRIKNSNIEAKNNEIFKELALKLPITEKLFYNNNATSCDAKIIAIVLNDKIVDEVNIGEKCWIILDKTTFYATSGGEIGDVGIISKSKVLETKKLCGEIIGHFIITNENLKVNDNVSCFSFRKNVCKNHTATHLLQSALKIVLGNEVQQKGSYVDENGLRFDFSSNRGLTSDEIKQVEDIVNNWISNCMPIKITEMQKDTAEKIENVVKLFDEKYGDKVRVVSVIDDKGNSISSEFCGGIHCKNTGEIEEFIIESEKSIGSSIRRITATTGKDKCLLIKNLNKITKQLSTLTEEYTKYKSCSAIKDRFEKIYEIIEKQALVNNNFIYINNDKKLDQDTIKIICRHISCKKDKPVVSITDINDEMYFYYITSPKNSDFDCNSIAQKIINEKNGKGGGNKNFAQFTCNTKLKQDDFNNYLH